MAALVLDREKANERAPKIMASKLDYTWASDALATKAGVPAALVSALINAESSWNTNAVSPTGATGLGQFTKATAKDYGLAGNNFDNRTDAALNLTACVRYLADLHKTNPTWREVIGHYSGQGTELANYARYSAGQALIATIAMVDGVPMPPPPDGTVIVIDGVSAHDLASGKRYQVVLGAEQALQQVAQQIAEEGVSTAPKLMMLGVGLATLLGLGGIVASCSQGPMPEEPPIASASIPALPQQEPADEQLARSPQTTTVHGFSFDGSSFRLVPGPLGPLAAPVGGRR